MTPWFTKALCWFVVAYALSPIDLIPDFVPVLGYLDDVVLLPALIWLAVQLLPSTVLQTSRSKAQAWMLAKGSKPRTRAGAWLIVLLWLGCAGLGLWWWWEGRS